MPKLDEKVASQVNEAESGGTLMEEGIYEMVLTAVEATGKDKKPLTGAAGPYWKATFAFPEDAERYAKRKQWMNLSLSAESAWKMKEFFSAFGVPADTDTDALIGKRCLVQIGSRTIQQGDKAGEVVNNPEKLMPLDGASAPAGKGKGEKVAKKDLF